ncbi:MAG: sugar kinase [Treponema sp.]|jgi:sugar/nucleoside kinase (ribokinase family)|nr:sugar kinase [Treponema sp.]
MGELLVEIMRIEKDKPLDAPDLFKGPFPSGAPAIFISAAAQLGNRTKIWGGVAKDKFGDVLLGRLTGDGVDVSAVNVAGTGATGVAFVAYDGSGGREFIFHLDGTPAADISFTETGDIPDFFHVMGCSLTINDRVKAEIEHACSYFSAAGAKISFDPNIRPGLLRDRGIMNITGKVMESCSVFLPGLDELTLFAEGRTGLKKAAVFLLDRFPGLEIVHVKLGKRGSRIITRNTDIEIPIYPIEKKYPVIDPTGAGDSFDAAFVSGLAAGMSLMEAGKLAAKAGAINSTVLGPMAGDIKGNISRELV